MREFTVTKTRKRRTPYRRHSKHKTASALENLEPEIQKALEELPAWLERHGHRANLH